MHLLMVTLEEFLVFVPVITTLQALYLIYFWALLILLDSQAVFEEIMVEKIN